MKQYIAKPGGRYTYTEDFINLQELALSATALFDDCSNFIISGCVISGAKISSGYVWINGQIRHFEGCSDAIFPYYIFESNSYETVTYANDVNNQGRVNYLCKGQSKSVPSTKDPVTNTRPQYIELTEKYSPRLIDKFFGKYSLLLENPFAKQSIKGDIDLAGSLFLNGDIHSMSGIMFGDPGPEATLRIGKHNGVSSQYGIGMYANSTGGNQVSTQLIIGMLGTFQFLKRTAVIASLDGDGMKVTNILSAKYLDTSMMRITANDIYINTGTTDNQILRINRYGYQGGITKYRSLEVYDGRNATPLLRVDGPEQMVTVNSLLQSRTEGSGIEISHSILEKTDKKLTGTIYWSDRNSDRMASLGYDTEDFDFTLRNPIGNIVLAPGGYVNIVGELKVNGKDIETAYVSAEDFATKLSGKVDKVAGKGLSSEDFTTNLKQKLEGIKSDPIGSGTGFVIAKDVNEALAKKMNIAANLSELPDKSAARINLSVYSQTEGDLRYLRTERFLAEFTEVTVEEIQGLSPEQITELLAEKARKARQSIRAEEAGTGDKKLAKASNLSDVADKSKARQNIGVYSIDEIDRLLAGKIDNSNGYQGAVFTTEHKTKLDAIKTGRFAGKASDGSSISQVEGYVMTSAVLEQLKTKANLLMDGYTAAQKTTIADNIAVYSKTAADERYPKVSNSFQDFITYLVSRGNTTTASQQKLRTAIGAAGTSDVDLCVKKSQLLADLTISNDTQRKQICNRLGAAYAADYQPKLNDTGWISCTGSNAGTLFARQIGNQVCVQGTINTGKRTGGNWGGVVAVIPNQVQPPRFACRTTLCTWNDGHKYNRGSSFVISAGSRSIVLYESGWNNQLTEISFSYMV